MLKEIVGAIAIASLLNLGSVTVFAADQGMQGQSEKKKSEKQQKAAPGAGPQGEMEKGGAGPSGPQTNAPGKAPGFEGAAKKKGEGQSGTGQ